MKTDLTIHDAMAAFRAGTLTSVALVEACLRRIEERRHLNVLDRKSVV